MTQVGEVVTAAELQRNVEEAAQRTPVIDIHTHLFQLRRSVFVGNR